MGLMSILKDRGYEKNVSNLYAETVEKIVTSKKAGYHARPELSATIKNIDKQLKKYPDDSVLHLLKATLHNERREYEEALGDLKHVKTDDEDVLEKVSKIEKHIGLNFELKKAFYEQKRISEFNIGNHDIATDYLILRMVGEERAADFLDNEELRHYAKGHMFREIKNKEEAKKEFEAVLETSPNLDSEVLTKIIEIPEKNHPAFEALVNKDFFFVRLGDIEELLGNIENAVKYHERALEINPEQPRSNYLLPFLRKDLVEIQEATTSN